METLRKNVARILLKIAKHIHRESVVAIYLKGHEAGKIAGRLAAEEEAEKENKPAVSHPRKHKVALPPPPYRRAIRERDGFSCHYCGEWADTVDHKIPRAKSGTNAHDNLVACCKDCNREKGDTSYEEFVVRKAKRKHFVRTQLRQQKTI